MSETFNNKNVFSLLEVTKSIQKTISDRYCSSFWVKAEMNKLNFYPYSGHCYPDLIEKKEGKLVAQIKANLWKDDYEKINNHFLKILKEPLKDGINILFCARINYDPVHGLTVRITDIDPSYTMGELEREKQETIIRLKVKGIFENNKLLSLPLLPKRIAIISVETSKGYSDFLNVIEKNSWGYKFFHMLFPAVLQGENAVESISRQLKKIKIIINHFDVVTIIRGGGGDVGLSCFNDFSLSGQIALFPIPVLTGIGHSTNETVVEMIAYKNTITPTELADFLIQNFHNFSVPVTDSKNKIFDLTGRIITGENNKINNSVRIFHNIIVNRLERNVNELENNIRSIISESRHFLSENTGLVNRLILEIKKFAGSLLDKSAIDAVKQRLLLLIPLFVKNNLKEIEIIEKKNELLNPVNVLKRGYSITYLKSKSVKSIAGISESDELETIISDGSIISIVRKTKKK